MSLADTLSRCDTTAFVTAIALVAEAKRREAAVRDPSIAEIQDRVCARFGVNRIEMRSDRRSRYVARPRQVAMFLARHLTAQSLPAIGRAFGGRDHTTVIYACRQVERLRAADRAFDMTVIELERELSPSQREGIAQTQGA